MENGSEHKKAKGSKKCIIKHGFMFENYKDSLFNNKFILNRHMYLEVIATMYILKKSIKLL